MNDRIKGFLLIMKSYFKEMKEKI